MSAPTMDPGERALQDARAATAAAEEAYWAWNAAHLVVGSRPGTPERADEDAEKGRLRKAADAAEIRAQQAHVLWASDARTPHGYRALREVAGWTQEQYAQMIDRDRMTVGGRETERQPITTEAALALLYLIEHKGRTPWDTHTNGDER